MVVESLKQGTLQHLTSHSLRKRGLSFISEWRCTVAVDIHLVPCYGRMAESTASIHLQEPVRNSGYFEKKGIAVSHEAIRRCLIEMGAYYVKATLEYAETFSDEVVKEREEFAREFIADVKAKPDDVVVPFEDEMSIDRSHNGGYG